MEEDNALTPNDIRAIEFYGDEITGALIYIEGDPRIYVPLRPLCTQLGLAWSGQFERIQRDEVLSSVLRFVRMTRTNTPGGAPNILCIPLEFLPGWLFGIDANRIKKSELKEKVILYRRECYQRLWDAFKHDILRAPEPEPTAIQPTSGAALAYELATVVQNMAREQMILEKRVNKSAQWAKGIDSRLTALELRVIQDEETVISEAQAADLSLAVKAVAHALEQQGSKNGYQRVYGELYRKHDVTSYKSVPKSKYAEVMQWLREWNEELTKGQP